MVPIVIYWCPGSGSALVHVMACCLLATKISFETILNQSEILFDIQKISVSNIHLKMS